jgi:transcriptional regulator with XRE-family HTH domain
MAKSRRPTEQRVHLPDFGDFLKRARLAAEFKTQQEAARAIGSMVSQSQIAQLETGRVKDPDVTTLHELSRIYRVPFYELIAELVQEKYSIPQIPMEVLTIQGLANWERGLPELPLLWIAAPNFVDEDNAQIFDAVVANLKRGTHICYFVRENDMVEGEKFSRLRTKLERLPDLHDIPATGQVAWYALKPVDLRWFAACFVIANPMTILGEEPSGPRTEGFVVVNHDYRPAYGIRMSEADLKIRASFVDSFIKQYKPGEASTNVLTFSNSRRRGNR